MATIELYVDEALRLTVGRVRGADELAHKKIILSREPTDLRTAIRAVSDEIPPSIPFFFHNHRHAYEAARKLIEPPATRIGRPALPVYVPRDITNLPPPPLPSPERRRALWHKLKDGLPGNENTRPSALIFSAPFCEGTLASLAASLRLTTIDAEPDTAKDSISSIQMLYDTGAQLTTISDDLLSEELRLAIASEANQDYISERGLIQISATIAFTSSTLELDTIAVVYPHELMPNKFSGVILGQRGAIDCLVVKTIPRKFLADLPDGYWGEMHVSQSYDPVEETITEY